MNAALRAEAANVYRKRAPRFGGAAANGGARGSKANAGLPVGHWHALPEDDEVLQRMVDGAVQQSLAWLNQSSSSAEEAPIEVMLSCLLSKDAEDIERGWEEEAAQKEGVLADAADSILAALLAEYALEVQL
jgi:hypothetical protein